MVQNLCPCCAMIPLTVSPISALLLVTAAGLALWQVLRYAAAPPSWMKTWVKTGSVAALALAAPGLSAPWAITLGLALGAVGDFCLSRPGERAFLAGMGAFAAGHLAYLAAFVGFGATLPGAGAILGLLVLGASTELWLAPRTGALRWPVRGYVLIILAMALAALGLPPEGFAGQGLVLLGALSFVASDLILAVEMFVLPEGRLRQIARRVLWVLYWGGQALILWGARG